MVLSHLKAYLSRNPSASIVNKMENLLRTVNIGRLVEEDVNDFSSAKHQHPMMPNDVTASTSFSLNTSEMRTYFSRLVPNRPVI